jgi:hypothetical protein
MISLHERNHITLKRTASVYREVRTRYVSISFTQLVLQTVTLRFQSNEMLQLMDYNPMRDEKYRGQPTEKC